jgi:hypothetical protein
MFSSSLLVLSHSLPSSSLSSILENERKDNSLYVRATSDYGNKAIRSTKEQNPRAIKLRLEILNLITICV